jgi:pSer/pThr/pTyr-binding forkhead associated (FHA) protein
MLEPRFYAFLREETTGKVYDIQWTPAVIGRPTAEVDHNLTLAVNVQLLPNGMTISRRHAQITFSDGRYYLEPLAENNPVLLNGKEVRLNSKREIKNGDKLVIGRHEIAMAFSTQQVSSSGVKSQPQPFQQPAKPVFQQAAQPISRPVQHPATPQPGIAQPPPPQSDQNKTLMGSEETPPAYLVIERATTNEQVGQRLPIVDYPFALGRNLPLLSAESEVSRRHAQLEFDQRSMRYFITDFQSTNGVTLEGEPIKPNRPYEVKPGMRIGLGTKVVLRFVV